MSDIKKDQIDSKMTESKKEEVKEAPKEPTNDKFYGKLDFPCD